jgi:NTE family protein
MLRSILVAIVVLSMHAGALRAQACTPRRTALVLSGGGAKGLAHVGLLRALDSLGVRPDLVVGTSMGSIVGALHAAGLSGREIDSLVAAAPGGTLVRSFRPLAPRALGALQPMASVVEGEGVNGLQTGAIREQEVNATLVSLLLFGNLRARGDFDSLPIPFRAVATDFRARRPVVLGSGDLALAVRASIAIPLVFAPVELDGMTLVDGGLTANVPVGIARALGAERVIVSDVSGPLPETVPLVSTGAVAQKLMDYVFEQPLDSLGPEDVYVRHPVNDFGSLDFSPGAIAQLVALGRETSDSVLADASCLATLQGDRPRTFRPIPRFVGAITVTDGRGSAARVATNLGFRPGDSIPWAEVRERASRLGESELIEGVWLYPSGQGDTVSFAPRIRLGPRLWAGAGFAYDNTLGGRLWLGALSENALGLGLELSSKLALGGLRDELDLTARKNVIVRFRPLAPMAQFVAADERVPLYDDEGNDLTDRKVRELVGFAGLERVFGSGFRVRAGVEGRTWEVDDVANSAGGFMARVDRFEEWDRARGFAEVRATGAYTRALLEARVPFFFSRRAGLRTHVRAGTGTDLPLHLTFPLGGDDGFPGVRPAELRGDRELSFQGQLWARLIGSIDGIVDLGVGRVVTDGVVDGDDWLTGARVGVRMDTPVGPLSVSHGWASGGRANWFVRLFRWF